MQPTFTTTPCNRARELHSPSVDIYLTYRCNLRCVHCFVGESLDTNADFPWDSLQSLIKTVPKWGTTQITFLGGEPTLYPHLVPALALCRELNIHPRIVTNGGPGFSRFLARNDHALRPTIGVSVDGSTPAIHDRIRGNNSFVTLIENIKIAKEHCYPIFGIVSVARYNVDDLENILQICAELALDWVNIHYVSNRGFAEPQQMLSIDEWQDTVQRIERASSFLDIPIRVERTFVGKSSTHRYCAVRSEDNLMFFPDGRVFYCSMFIDIQSGHAQTWDGMSLQPHEGPNEKSWAGQESPLNCPAIPIINPGLAAQVLSRQLDVPCIFAKETLLKGTWGGRS